MGQAESQPVVSGGTTLAPVMDPLRRKESLPQAGSTTKTSRKPALSTTDNDTASQVSSKSALNKAGWSPLQWAATGAEMLASATADVALTTVSAAYKTASVLASTTEAAANVVANTTSNVAINTASVATQTASLITTATSVGAKTAGDAIAGTATLVVEGFSTTGVPTTSPKHITRDARSRSRSGDSSGQLSPQAKAAFFATTGGRAASELILPEAMALGTMKSSQSRDDLAEIDTSKAPMRNAGTRFWCMVGATNISARKHWVATVTSSKPSAPSAKYLRKILDLAWETRGQSVEEFYGLLHQRPITKSPNCALKALITTLRLIREGPAESLGVSISHVGLIDAMGASWAERVLLDVSPEDTPADQLALKDVDDSLNQMLIARLSGLLVQKMHFHSRHSMLNARYEAQAKTEATKPDTTSTPRSSQALKAVPSGGKEANSNPSGGGRIFGSTSKSETVAQTNKPLVGFNGTSRPETPVKHLQQLSKSGSSPEASDDDQIISIMSSIEGSQQDDWERDVQLSSSFLTLLGTIEGVVRLALGMGGQNDKENLDQPSLAAQSLTALLIEEALSIFDALSGVLLQVVEAAQKPNQDINLARALLSRYQEAYKNIRLYCHAARQFPYVTALNKVPELSEELSPLSRGGLSELPLLSYSAFSSTGASAFPTTNSSSQSLPVSPVHNFFASPSGTSKKPSQQKPSQFTLNDVPLPPNFSLVPSPATNGKAPSLAARPFTRSSILETLEEEEALESRLGVSSVATDVTYAGLVEQKIPSAPDRPATSAKPGAVVTSEESNNEEDSDEELPEGLKQSDDDLARQWGNFFFSNSIEHAKPPSQFCLDDDDAASVGSAGEYNLNAQHVRGTGGPSVLVDGTEKDGRGHEVIGYGSEILMPVRSKTTRNPFDTGNSSIVLLAEAHRSAFSTISNPFASGQFNPFSTNVLSGVNAINAVDASNPNDDRNGAKKPDGLGTNSNVVDHHKPSKTKKDLLKQRQEATKRALDQCERLFEFSGINMRPEQLNMSKGELIGRGAFSVVHRAILISTGQEVAVKELLIEEWGRSPETILDFRAEVAVMKAVHHPNVLQLIGASTAPNLRLISEFCHRGNLFDLLFHDRKTNPQRSRILAWSLRLRLALGEARGMHFLHTAFPAPLIHRDLKSLNLLLSKNWTLKVSDFGLARFRRKGVNDGPCGTTQWMAPEVILGKDYDERADVYSFGVNLWEMCTRRVPWEGRADVRKVVVMGERLKLDETTLDEGCPPQLLALIEKCWSTDPNLRPHFGTIVAELKSISKMLQ